MKERIENEISALGNLLMTIALSSIKFGVPQSISDHIDDYLKNQICDRYETMRQIDRAVIDSAAEAQKTAFNNLSSDPVYLSEDEAYEDPMVTGIMVGHDKEMAKIEEQKREEAIKQNLIAHVAGMHEMMAKDFPVEPGQIFYSSWGYDQTNIDFYEVIGLTKSGKSAIIRPIKANGIYDGQYMSSKLMPVPGDFSGESMTKRIQLSSGFGGPVFRLSSYSSAWRWDGKEKTATHYA